MIINRSRFLNNVLVLGAITLSSVLTACNNSGTTQESNSQAASSSGETLKIAVIPKGTTHTFWNSVHAGAMKADRELDNVEIIWQGPHKEDDRQMQIQVVQNFVSRGVNGIVLAPLDERSLVPPVKAAINRKIPVVIFDSDLASKDYASFVATDNFAGGKLCAQQMAKLLDGKGNIILLRYSEGSASTHAREEGFLAGMKEYAPNAKLISTNQYAGATMEKAFQASQNLLNRFANVDGIFCPNESATQGMLRALQTAGKAGKVKLVGFDSNETLVTALDQGTVHGLALQDPFNMGYLGVKTIVALIKGEKFEKRIDTGVTMATKENINDPKIKTLLTPDLKYLQEQ
ncbi:ABC transporter substrate-binding protein [Adhaeribacter radiodurans]|uniref:Substrate-binding domain-containing protein n=1 Tax=Adhaeribacter radiodurans TaxID=2745197 RepID=A0A7L7LB66_9BACT|nr:substrate-binding domain-containing protein [Adhaeribacter radiodurans]QMU30072.1 substrate-binding domain-containing protein [Adhaeribacter radiodurans]